MTDRELLELAAKAAGYVLDADGDRLDQRDSGGGPTAWNPLTDDGDALRLAVQLRLCLDTYMDPSSRFDTDERCTLALLPPPSDYSVGEWHEDSGPYAATRRAIVRAAAEIGKAMP